MVTCHASSPANLSRFLQYSSKKKKKRFLQYLHPILDWNHRYFLWQPTQMATALQVPPYFCFNSKPLFSTSFLNDGRLSSVSNFVVSVSNSKSNCRSSFRVRAIKEKTEEIKTSSSAEEITKKYGLEVGLWKVLFFLPVLLTLSLSLSSSIVWNM